MANLTGTLSSKEGFHLGKRAPGVLGHSTSKSSWCYPLIFLSRSLCWGGGKHRVKEEHCVPWTIHFGKEEPGPIFCLPSKQGWQQPAKSKGCSAPRASPPLLVNFKLLLQRSRQGSQGRREKAIEKGAQVIF